jgi:signal transduction histidine kinase
MDLDMHLDMFCRESKRPPAGPFDQPDSRSGRADSCASPRRQRAALRRAAHRRDRHEHRHRRRRSRRAGRPHDDSAEAHVKASRTPEERAYRAARRRANRRLGFFTHFVVYGAVLMLLVVTTRSIRAVLIVASAWGIGVFLHYFWSMLAPRLRERWIEREVGERVDQDVDSERRRVEDRHVRHLEDLSASIAHEIRNPITAAKSLVQQMGEDPVSESNLEFASVALDELDRVERSISHLLRFARDEDLRCEPMRMSDVVASAIETFRDRLKRSGVVIECQMDTPGQMRGDADKLRRVVINLIGNALDAMGDAGTTAPKIVVMSGDNLAGTEVWLRVSDNGPGIPEATRAKIFDPFYTTKQQGTGLGLALSKKIVEAHGGSMELMATSRSGSEFVLSFPKEQIRTGGSSRRRSGETS